MTEEQLDQINSALERGEKPEDVARRFGTSRSGLNFQLLQAGKKIVIYRRLENTAPIGERREMAAA